MYTIAPERYHYHFNIMLYFSIFEKFHMTTTEISVFRKMIIVESVIRNTTTDKQTRYFFSLVTDWLANEPITASPTTNNKALLLRKSHLCHTNKIHF